MQAGAYTKLSGISGVLVKGDSRTYWTVMVILEYTMIADSAMMCSLYPTMSNDKYKTFV